MIKPLTASTDRCTPYIIVEDPLLTVAYLTMFSLRLAFLYNITPPRLLVNNAYLTVHYMLIEDHVVLLQISQSIAFLNFNKILQAEQALPQQEILIALHDLKHIVLVADHIKQQMYLSSDNLPQFSL